MADRASIAIIAAAIAVDLICRCFPAHLPYLFPFIFNAPVFLGTWFLLLWYVRGMARTSVAERPGRTRQIFFLIGIGSIYFVLQTRCR
jgi:hypothetical protein